MPIGDSLIRKSSPKILLGLNRNSKKSILAKKGAAKRNLDSGALAVSSPFPQNVRG